MVTGMASQSERERLELAVARFFHMANSHCPANLAPLLTDDVELLADQQAQGEEAVHRYFVWLWDCYPELTFKLENAIVNGTSAAAEVTYTGGPGGRGARCIVLHFRGELIRRIRCY